MPFGEQVRQFDAATPNATTKVRSKSNSRGVAARWGSPGSRPDMTRNPCGCAAGFGFCSPEVTMASSPLLEPDSCVRQHGVNGPGHASDQAVVDHLLNCSVKVCSTVR